MKTEKQCSICKINLQDTGFTDYSYYLFQTDGRNATQLATDICVYCCRKLDKTLTRKIKSMKNEANK